MPVTYYRQINKFSSSRALRIARLDYRDKELAQHQLFWQTQLQFQRGLFVFKILYLLNAILVGFFFSGSSVLGTIYNKQV